MKNWWYYMTVCLLCYWLTQAYNAWKKASSWHSHTSSFKYNIAIFSGYCSFIYLVCECFFHLHFRRIALKWCKITLPSYAIILSYKRNCAQEKRKTENRKNHHPHHTNEDNGEVSNGKQNVVVVNAFLYETLGATVCLRTFQIS